MKLRELKDGWSDSSGEEQSGRSGMVGEEGMAGVEGEYDGDTAGDEISCERMCVRASGVVQAWDAGV